MRNVCFWVPIAALMGAPLALAQNASHGEVTV